MTFNWTNLLTGLRAWAKRQSRRPWAIRLLRTLIAAYMWAVYASARKTIRIDPGTQALMAAGVPLLIGNWHSRLFLFAPFWRHCGHLPLSVISSPHADGLIVGGAAEVLGLKPLRGTRGGKGGAAAMRAGLRALWSGHCLMLNPDGPAGPRQVLGDGTAALAQLGGAPFVAVTYSARPARFSQEAWDRSLLVRPFSRLILEVSAPLWFDKTHDRATVRQQIEQLMNAQMAELDSMSDTSRVKSWAANS